MRIDIRTANIITPVAFLMELGKILIANNILQNEKGNLFLQDLSKYEDIPYTENIYMNTDTVQINALVFNIYTSMIYSGNQ